MCGRFTLRTPAHDVAKLFEVTVADFAPRYNIAPSQDVAAIRFDPQQSGRELVWLRWGLVPFWAEQPKTNYSMINARAETVAKKPAFRQAFQKRRCLIVADGFFEWQKTDGRKQPYHIHMRDGRAFAFAGLWERWQNDEQIIESCCIIVTDANDMLAPIHDRMPVILPSDVYDLWLDPEFSDKQKLQELLQPYPAEEMDAYAVSTVVNNPKNDVKACVEALDGHVD